MTFISFCIKFSHENFAVGLQGGMSLMSLQASLATINYLKKTTNKKICFQVYVFLLSLGIFATLPSVFLTLLDEFGVTRYP
jgi:hypothetical protein